jgi:hypothetical protein
MDFNDPSSLKATIPPLLQLNETLAHPNDVADVDPTAENLER